MMSVVVTNQIENVPSHRIYPIIPMPTQRMCVRDSSFICKCQCECVVVCLFVTFSGCTVRTPPQPLRGESI